MITQRTRGLNTLLTLGQIAISVAVFWFYLWIFVQVYRPPDFVFERYTIYSILLCLGLFYHAVTGDFLYRNPLGQGFSAVQATTFRQIVYISIFLLVYLAAAKDRGISRIFLFSFLFLLYGSLLSANYWLPGWLAGRLFRGWRSDRTLLIGKSSDIARLRAWLHRKMDYGLSTVGVLTDDPGVTLIEEYPVLGRIADLPTAIRSHDVTQVILTDLPPSGDLVGEIAAHCDTLGIRFIVVANLEQRFRHSIRLINDEGHRFITLREEPLENPFNRTIKRMLDIAVALPVVLFILPVTTILVWICQRFQSPGPVFYNQARAGFHDVPFKILKYRTMHVNNTEVARQATKDDDRIYPAGRFFRKYSVDELPQFINVLQGEMSVVGPRPHLPQHNEMFASVMKDYRVRALVKPGITGLAQVRGFRGETKEHSQLVGRVESDIYYIENWSFGMDVMIILRTIWQMFFPPKSAY